MAAFFDQASYVPLTVPSPPNATASDIARYNGQFVANGITSANALLAAYLELKDVSFYQVGDLPGSLDNTAFFPPSATPAPPRSTTSPAVSWAAIEAAIAQLAQIPAPTAPTLASVDATVPALDATPPTIILPAAPNPDVGAPPSGAPNIADAALPAAPTIVLPNVPTLQDLALPTPPTYDLPSFSASVPQNNLAPPTQQFSYVDPGYVSVLHDPLVQKLLGDMNNGTYGIEPGDETALWFRARDRAASQAKDEVDEAFRRMASTSFPMPQGTVIKAIAQAEAKSQRILSDANRDIALRRSELYVEGRKFTIQQVKEYEQIRISLYNAQQERALNYSKAVVELGIALYDASVRNYSTLLEAYKTQAQVFESQIRAQLAKAELYRTQLDAEKVRLDFNRSKIDIFNAQLSAINQTVAIYKAQLEAANLFTQIQAQKIEVFKAQVMAYTETVRAKEAQYNIYLAQIKGQLASLDVYKSQIDAYNSRISAIETQARVKLQSNEALVQAYRVAVQQYNNLLDSLNKQLNGQLEEARLKGVYYGYDIAAYNAATSAYDASAQALSRYATWSLDKSKASLAARVAQVEFALKQLGLSVDLQKSVNAGGIDFMKGLISSAASGLNSIGTNSA